MKVLLVATVQSHICQFHRPLVKMLHDHGWEVHVAARDNLAEKNGLKLDFAEKVFDVPFARSPFHPRNLKAYRQLKRIVAQGEYDVLHCNTPVGGILGRLAGRKARKQGTRVFYTAHGFHFYRGGPKKSWLIYYPIEKFMCRFTDKLITINGEDYALAKEKFSANVCRIHGIGARSDKYAPWDEAACQSTRRSLGYGEKEKLILCTGELLPNKNQSTAVHAMARLVQTHPEARLLLAGNGPERENLENEIRALGLCDHAQLLGYRTDLERFVNIADIILSCSYREGLPLNIVEGMLCRKPVVASINRGHKELVREGITGWLVPAADAQGFAQKLAQLLESPGTMAAMAAAARDIGLEYADVSVARELEEIYFERETICASESSPTMM